MGRAWVRAWIALLVEYYESYLDWSERHLIVSAISDQVSQPSEDKDHVARWSTECPH